ncbi:MAG: hypothetical protein KME12_09035 [Trichocoleus desertorum ATA4-8-CV12]|nr:hypothetical protein [Trichocoleus desertorum ATA4-8-CV12]
MRAVELESSIQKSSDRSVALIASGAIAAFLLFLFLILILISLILIKRGDRFCVYEDELIS